MIRSNLGMALQGLAVIPLFAGWDLDRERGRIFSYDVTGGRSEEQQGYAATGSGSLFARGSMKKLYREDLTEQQAVTLVVQRCTTRRTTTPRRRPGCGPQDLPHRQRDRRRGLPAAHGGGVRRGGPVGPGTPPGAPDGPRAALRLMYAADGQRRDGWPVSTPFYVSPQQAMADRAEYAARASPGRSLVVMQYADGIVFVGENRPARCTSSAEIYDRIGFAAAGKSNEYENLRIGWCPLRRLRATPTTGATSRPAASRTCRRAGAGTDSSQRGEKPNEVELVVAEVGEAPEGDQIYRLPHDGSIVDEHGSVAVGGSAEQIGSLLDQRHRERHVAGRGAEAGRAGAVAGQQRQ